MVERQRVRKQRRRKKRFSWSDTDFTYLLEQPKIVQHLATLYEYARESDVIIRAVTRESEEWEYERECMELGQVPPRRRTGPVRRRLVELYPDWELCFLFEMPGFPKRSFQKTLDFEITRRTESGVSYSKLIEEFLERGEPGNLTVTPLGNPADLPSRLPSYRFGTESYLLRIPWKKSDFEIATEFRNILPDLRPDYLPNNPHPGRRGRGATATGKDLRDQLSAFRVQQSGGSWSKDFGQYSRPAWHKAVRTAARRIAAMPTSYLFGPRQSGR